MKGTVTRVETNAEQCELLVTVRCRMPGFPPADAQTPEADALRAELRAAFEERFARDRAKVGLHGAEVTLSVVRSAEPAPAPSSPEPAPAPTPTEPPVG
jgi:hypothetical protein